MDVDAPPTDLNAKPAYDILKDPWTDEQETSLFKGLIRWKPAGMVRPYIVGAFVNTIQAYTGTFA